MLSIEEIPLVMPIAEFIWGGSSSDGSDDNVTPPYSPSLCLSTLPLMTKDCWIQLVVKGLGVAIILGAFLNKVPIMMNILNSKSVVGLSKGSIYGEVLMYGNGAIYGILQGYPITSYGENGALLLEAVIIVLMVWNYDATTTKVEMVLATVAFAIYLFVGLTMLPPEYQSLLMGSIWPIMLYGRGSQMLETFQCKHCGAQSIITLSMNLVGILIRIATTASELGGDVALMTGFILSGVLNGILFAQYFLYRENTERFLKELKEKKD